MGERLLFDPKDYFKSTTPSYKTQLDDILKRIDEHEDFTYDLNNDVFYNQLKDKYISQGKMASEDVIGKATALTGGYGNSYATTASQQAYNEHLGNLNDMLPQLYQLAYDKYRDEKEDLYSQYSIYKDLYRDEVADKQWDKTYDLNVKNYDLNLNKYKDETKNQELEDLLAAYGDALIDLEDANTKVTEAVEARAALGFTDDKSTGYRAAEEQVSKMSNNDDIYKFLDMAAAPTTGLGLTEEERAELGDKYSLPDLKDRTWTEVSDGGRNRFGGIDRNAEVTDGRGNTFSLADLVDALVDDGMSRKEAKEKVKEIQKDLKL